MYKKERYDKTETIKYQNNNGNNKDFKLPVFKKS